MLRDGTLSAILLVSVALLSALAAAGPLFASATAYGLLVRRLDALPAVGSANARAGLQLTVDGLQAGALPQIEAAVRGIPYLSPPQTSIYTNPLHAAEQWGSVPCVRADEAGGKPVSAVLYYRTGALDSLSIASGTRGAKGVWLPQSIAEKLNLRPGDGLRLETIYSAIPTDHKGPLPKSPTARVTLAGTYKTRPDGRSPLGAAFQHVLLPANPQGSCTTVPDPEGTALPAVLMIGDLPTVSNAFADLDDFPLLNTTADLTAAGRTPKHLHQAAVGVSHLQDEQADVGGDLFTALRGDQSNSRISTGLPAIEKQTAADAVKARQQGHAVAYAGGALGLAALLLALWALAQRRQRETELLIARGTPIPVVVTASALELLLPALLGAGAGLAVAGGLFSRYGPHAGLDPDAFGSAARYAVATVLVTLAGAALVTLVQIFGIWRRLSGSGALRFASQLASVLLGATVVAVAAILTRPRGQSFQDPLAPLLPILVLACGCIILVRGAVLAGPFLRRRRPSGRPRSADRLVRQGLRGTGVAVADLVIVLSIGIGVFTYGLLVRETMGQAVPDKAAALAGARTSAALSRSWLLGGGDGPAPDLGPDSAVVWRAQGNFWEDRDHRYDVLVVDPATLLRAADWGSGPDLAAARAALPKLGSLSPDAPDRDRSQLYPSALLVGAPAGLRFSAQPAFQVGPASPQVRIVARLKAFPGARGPTLVVDSRSFFLRLPADLDPSVHDKTDDYYGLEDAFQAWVWTRDSLEQLQQRMAEHDVPLGRYQTLAQAQATPDLLAGTWAAAYQALLGLVAVALAGLATVVAVDRRVARAAPVDLLLKRFGFRPSRLLRLRLAELAVTGLAALVVMTLPVALLLALMPRLIEPAADLPPSLTILVTPWPVLTGVAAAVVVILLAAAAAARRSAALKPGEVLRDES